MAPFAINSFWKKFFSMYHARLKSIVKHNFAIFYRYYAVYLYSISLKKKNVFRVDILCTIL